MTKNLKNIALLMILIITPKLIMPMHKNVQMEAPIPKENQASNKNKTNYNRTIIPETQQKPVELTTAQKFAIQTRNTLGRTTIPNQGWIDSIAQTRDFKTSDGTRVTRQQPFIEQPSRYEEHGIELSDMSKPIMAEYQKINNLQRIISLDKNRIATKNVVLNNIKRPKETKILNTNSENPRDTQYRNFLDQISYENLRKNMIQPQSNGYTSRIDAVNDYVNKLLIDIGTPDSFFLSARYMNRDFKEIVKKFSDTINRARNSKTQQEQNVAEQNARIEILTSIDPLNEIQGKLPITQFSSSIKAEPISSNRYTQNQYVKAQPLSQIDMLGELGRPSIENMQVAIIPGESVRDVSNSIYQRTGVQKEYNNPYERLTDLSDLGKPTGPKLIGPERSILQSKNQTPTPATSYDSQQAAERFKAFDNLDITQNKTQLNPSIFSGSAKNAIDFFESGSPTSVTMNV